MPNLDLHYPKPCANCDHRNLHGAVSGCIANTAGPGEPARWCPCDTYVSPRDRARERAQGVAEGEAGADAALHGHAMTHSEWRTKAEERMNQLILNGDEFTSEDVTDVAGVAPSPSAIGGLFKVYRTAMEPVGFKTATRREAHGRPLRVWKGKARG